MFENDSNYLDQHFLIDEDIINNFINVCNLNKNDTVLEIGPGTGVLSSKIKEKVNKLILIEKDIRLKKYLDKLDVEVIYDNVLGMEIPKCTKIITALPYSIIEPFIYKIIKSDVKEIYMIMGISYVNNCINKEINNLSLLTNTYFKLEKFFDIPKECFNPMPNTLSAAIKLERKETFNKIDLIIKNMYELNHKKVKNALMESLIYVYNLTKKESKNIIDSFNLDNNILDKLFINITNEELKELHKKIYIYANNH